MRKILSRIARYGGLVAAIVLLTAAVVEPSVGLYWVSSSDPTAGGGVCAPQWQILFRTDTNQLYVKTGTACTGWTPYSAGTGGGTVTSVTCGAGLTCTPNPIVGAGTAAWSSSGTASTVPKWTSSTVIGNSQITDDGTTIALGSPFSCTPGANSCALATNATLAGNQSFIEAGGFSIRSQTTAAIGTNQNNFNPFGASGNVTTIFRINATANITITGQSGGAIGGGAVRELYYFNAGTGTITLTNLDGSSSAGNQFITPTGQSVVIPVGEFLYMTYSNTLSAWIIHYVSSIAGASIPTANVNAITKWTAESSIGIAAANDNGSRFQITEPLDMNSHLVNNVTDPSSAQDAATKHYVDNVLVPLTANGDSTSGTPGTAVASISAAATHKIVNWSIVCSQASAANTQYTITVTYSDTTTTTLSSTAATNQETYGNGSSGGALIIIGAGAWVSTTALSNKDVTSIAVTTAGAGTGHRSATISGFQQ